MKINFIMDDEYLNHDTGKSHPENIERYLIVKSLIEEKYSQHNFIKPREVSLEELYSIHQTEYVNNIINSIPDKNFFYYDPDTIGSSTSLKSYLLAAGGSILAFEEIIRMNYLKKNSSFFCAHRPPGHHAEASKAMGFGVFNNVAVSAANAFKNPNINNILIVDFDVHHGNGTQHSFENNPNIVYASSHQFPFYPGSGDIAETGCGNIYNCPLEAGVNSKEFRYLFEKHIISPINQDFDLIYFSAGFDAHYKDPLASINLIDEDFYWVTDIVLNKFGGQTPVISVLEGGYDKEGLKNGLDEHLKALYEYNKNE